MTLIISSAKALDWSVEEGKLQIKFVSQFLSPGQSETIVGIPPCNSLQHA